MEEAKEALAAVGSAAAQTAPSARRATAPIAANGDAGSAVEAEAEALVRSLRGRADLGWEAALQLARRGHGRVQALNLDAGRRRR